MNHSRKTLVYYIRPIKLFRTNLWTTVKSFWTNVHESFMNKSANQTRSQMILHTWSNERIAKYWINSRKKLPIWSLDVFLRVNPPFRKFSSTKYIIFAHQRESANFYRRILTKFTFASTFAVKYWLVRDRRTYTYSNKDAVPEFDTYFASDDTRHEDQTVKQIFTSALHTSSYLKIVYSMTVCT